MLSYRLYGRLSGETWFRQIAPWGWLLLLPIVIYSLYFQNGYVNTVSAMSLYVGLALALPLLFIATGANKIDRFIGDLSYPIYVVHWLIMPLVAYWGLQNTRLWAPTVFGLVMISAFVLTILVERPMQRLRQVGGAKVA